MGIGIYAGSANPMLAAGVASRLQVPLGCRQLTHFPDGEVQVQIGESIRGQDIYVIQSTCTPVNEHLMELLIMLDAFHRASAGRITAVVPYFGYSRQEKKSTGREPISAKLVANVLATAGASRVVSIDLHNPAIQGFFDIWMDHLTAVPIITDYLASLSLRDAVIVSPDVGRVKLADRYARALDLPLVILHKRRLGAQQTAVRTVVGDALGKRPIIIDDMISTGGTVVESVRALLEVGALPEMVVAATHAVLVGPALERLSHPAIARIAVTDTIPIPPPRRLPTMTVLTVADLLAETIDRLHRDQSISALFDSQQGPYPV